MKVLWFTSTPSLAEKKLNKTINRVGWIKSLDLVMQKLIELNICFYHNKTLESFTNGATRYHPIPSARTSFFSKHYRNSLEPASDINKFLSVVEKVKPDIIHIHGTENPFGYLIDKTSVPIVLSIQGNITVCHHKYFSGLPQALSRTAPGLYHNLIRHTYQKKYLRFGKMKKRELHIMSKTKHIIGRTDWDRRISRIQAPASNYYHNDEILRDVFYQKKWQYKKFITPVIHSTISNNFFKGYETIVQSALLLEDIGFQFLWQIAGLKENEDLVLLVHKYLGRRSKNIKFLGSLDEVSLANAMLQADLYVLASHIENSPNSLCEAMLLGMPCISTLAGGTHSLLTNDKEGLIIQDGDPWSMSGAIIELLENPDLSIEYGKAARLRASKRHDPITISKELKAIYDRILKSQHIN